MFVGFQSPGTLGRTLLDGAKSIKSALGNADSETQTIYTGAAAIEEGAQQMSDNLKNTNGKSIYEAAAGIQEGAAKVTSGAAKQLHLNKIHEYEEHRSS